VHLLDAKGQMTAGMLFVKVSKRVRVWEEGLRGLERAKALPVL